MEVNHLKKRKLLKEDKDPSDVSITSKIIETHFHNVLMDLESGLNVITLLKQHPMGHLRPTSHIIYFDDGTHGVPFGQII